jgi:hypothetical protein
MSRWHQQAAVWVGPCVEANHREKNITCQIVITDVKIKSNNVLINLAYIGTRYRTSR